MSTGGQAARAHQPHLNQRVLPDRNPMGADKARYLASVGPEKRVTGGYRLQARLQWCMGVLGTGRKPVRPRGPLFAPFAGRATWILSLKKESIPDNATLCHNPLSLREFHWNPAQGPDSAPRAGFPLSGPVCGPFPRSCRPHTKTRMEDPMKGMPQRIQSYFQFAAITGLSVV